MRRSYFPRRLTLDWLRQAYRSDGLTPEELMQEIIARAQETRDKHLWIVEPSEELIFPYLQRLGEADFSAKPLWGIPFAVKDCLDLRGTPTTAACPAFSYQPSEDAETVRRLLEAGAVPVGKANMDQFATGLVGTRSPYGEVHNAFRDEMISGGSSSGSAVAVALGQSVFALGTDTAGSGRVPAALNHLVGYKPAVGAWPSKGMVPACASLDCVALFTNNVADALEIGRLLRGKCRDDCRSRDIPYQENQRPRRLYVPREPAFFGDYGEAYRRAWERMRQRLGRLGLPVREIDISLFQKAAEILYGGPYIAERWAALGDFVEKNPDAVFPVTKEILESGRGDQYSAATLFSTLGTLEEYKRQVRELLAEAVLILPTAGGTFTREQVDADPIATNSQMGLYTNHCNLLDLCAAALPSGFAGDGLPFGVTAFALAANEGMLSWLAPRYEKLWEETAVFAVCGLHMQGFPLEYQLTESGGRFLGKALTAPCYRLYRLPGPVERPGLVRQASGGAPMEVELWSLPQESLGKLLAQAAPPLGFGTVELADGSRVLGFLCEACAAEAAEDISCFGGWRAYQESLGLSAERT
ncbi:MAG TPA: allophanate hydrolase [Firmicutes bacterium]|nr:allophanate hydrolase [Bacillota bacterium]